MAERGTRASGVGAEGDAVRGAVLLTRGEKGSPPTLHTMNGLQLVAERPGHRRYATHPLIKATRRNPHSDFDDQFSYLYNHSFGGIDGFGSTHVQLVYVRPPEADITTQQHILRIPGYHEGPAGFRLTMLSNFEEGIPAASYLYKPNYSLQTHAAIAAEIPLLIGKASAVGVSTGGKIALMAADAHPELFGNIHIVEPGSIDGHQNPFDIGLRTTGSGLVETGKAYLTGDFQGGVALTEGAAWAANNISHSWRSAVRLLRALVDPEINGLEIAKRLNDGKHHIPSTMTIFTRDRVFRRGRMEGAYTIFVAAHGDPFALPIRVRPGGHFTLARDRKTADNLTETTIELEGVQRGREAQRLVA